VCDGPETVLVFAEGKADSVCVGGAAPSLGT
jgi:hypothetical protein